MGSLHFTSLCGFSSSKEELAIPSHYNNLGAHGSRPIFEIPHDEMPSSVSGDLVPATLNAVFRIWFWGKDGKPWSECMFLISPGNLVHWQWDSGRVACRERLLKATKSMRHSHFRPLLHPAHNLQSTTQLQTSTHCLPAMYILSMEDYRIFLHKSFCYHVPCTWCIYVTTYLIVWETDMTDIWKYHMHLEKSSW